MKARRSVLLSPTLLAVAVVVMILLSCTCPSPITPPAPPPTQPSGGGTTTVSITFTANRTSIKPGECATLTWNVEGTGQFWVELNGESVSPNSYRQVCPPQTTTYRLIAGTGAAPRQELRRGEIVITVQGAAPPPTKPPTVPPPTKPAPTATTKPAPTATTKPAPPPTAKPPTATPTTKPAPLTFTFDPKSGPAGSDVRLYLSRAVQPVTVYYNGQVLPKKTLDGGKTLEVTIPAGASTGYFELQWDGQNVRASEPFTVTPPPAKGDLILEDVFLSTDGRVILRVSQSPSDVLRGSFGYRVVAQATGVIVAQGSFAIPSGGQAFWTDYKPGGQVTLDVRIDPGNAIPETNENNNAMTKTLTPTPAVLSADLAVTDIYPDNMPQGRVWVRVTNHGHGTVTNVGITLECTALSTPRPGVYAPSQPVHAKRTIVINLSPGQTAAFDTGVTVDTDSFTYSVTASIQVPFQDPNPANNSYTEAIP